MAQRAIFQTLQLDPQAPPSPTPYILVVTTSSLPTSLIYANVAHPS